jgi:hypothetical protein
MVDDKPENCPSGKSSVSGQTECPSCSDIVQPSTNVTVMSAKDVCDGGRLQLERIIELKNRDGAELKGLFWNFTGEHHQMYL